MKIKYANLIICDILFSVSKLIRDSKGTYFMFQKNIS